MDPWQRIPEDMEEWTHNHVSLNQRYYFAWDSVRRNLGYTRHYALRLNLDTCTPHPELCTSAYCLACPGETYLCFFPCGGTEGLDLWDAPGNFDGEWFNPNTGETFSIPTVAGATRHVLQAPFVGPSVLYLHKR
jgi:hypothetical protein